jgi:hypothetical protein
MEIFLFSQYVWGAVPIFDGEDLGIIPQYQERGQFYLKANMQLTNSQENNETPNFSIPEDLNVEFHDQNTTILEAENFYGKIFYDPVSPTVGKNSRYALIFIPENNKTYLLYGKDANLTIYGFKTSPPEIPKSKFTQLRSALTQLDKDNNLNEILLREAFAKVTFSKGEGSNIDVNLMSYNEEKSFSIDVSKLNIKEDKLVQLSSILGNEVEGVMENVVSEDDKWIDASTFAKTSLIIFGCSIFAIGAIAGAMEIASPMFYSLVEAVLPAAMVPGAFLGILGIIAYVVYLSARGIDIR